MIKHIVMWKFKEGTENEVDAFLNALDALKKEMPIIKACKISRKNNPKNQFDAVAEMEFESLSDLETYKVDPRHVRVSTLCKSIRENRAAIDYDL